MDEVDPFPIGYVSPAGLVYQGGGRWLVPGASRIESGDFSWEVAFPDTHDYSDSAKLDWGVRIEHGDLRGEFDSPRPYLIVEYDTFYGKHWHELTRDQVADLHGKLGAMLELMDTSAIACDSE